MGDRARRARRERARAAHLELGEHRRARFDRFGQIVAGHGRILVVVIVPAAVSWLARALLARAPTRLACLLSALEICLLSLLLVTRCLLFNSRIKL